MKYVLPEPPVAGRALHEPAPRLSPNEPERPMKCVLPEPPMAGRVLHEPAPRVSPNEPERP